MRSVIDLTSTEARDYFLKGTSYSTLELPAYFNFSDLIQTCDGLLADTKLSSHGSPGDSQGGANHKVLQNKDGEFAWRKLELLHPFIYVDLVREVTEPEAWNEIQNRFGEFAALEGFTCSSIPKTTDEASHSLKLEVNSWWTQFEQKTLEMTFEHSHVIHTDISDCYGSIYTHAISWALHQREHMKANPRDYKYLGNRLDKKIRDMQWRESSGIPQGSVLMDLIAELVLGYLDELLHKALQQAGISDYQVIRFRDDYRIFTSSENVANRILQLLSVQAESLGLRINGKKTVASNDIASTAIKVDKLAWLQLPKHTNSEHNLHSIYEFSKRFPNSSRIKLALLDYSQELSENPFSAVRNPIQEIALSLEIGCRNPVAFPAAVSVIARLCLGLANDQASTLIGQAASRVSRVPNSNFHNIWLQRLAHPRGLTLTYTEPLCNRLIEPNTLIWTDEWLNTKSFKEALVEVDFFERSGIAINNIVIESSEISFDEYPG